MIPILYSAAETTYSTNGLGRLSDVIGCTVAEELNGAYELELVYPAAGLHADEIAEGCQIYVSHDETGDRQPFRIYRKTDVIDGVFTVYARHISGDLSRIPVMPYTAANLSAALSGISSHSALTNPFAFSTTLSISKDFAVIVPASAKAVLGAGDGSILGVFGGEVEYDKRTVTVLARRGTDTDVVVRYGKNMTGLEVVSEASAAYNAVVPYCKTQDGTVVCNPPVVSHGAYTEAVPLDLSNAFDGYIPSAAQLQSAATAWLNEHQPWITERAITVSFVQLRDTTEYADFAPLERVVLGDTIKVRHTQLGVDADFRVIKTTWDALQQRYTELTLGREVETVATMMSEMLQKIEEARNIAQEIANGTYNGGTFIDGELIFSPSIYGGQIYIGPKTGGGYNFIVDSSGNIETAGGMIAKGNYQIRRDDSTPGSGTVVGYMGRAKGSDGAHDTYGVALVGPNGSPNNISGNSTYVIVTNAGVRMQGGRHSIYVCSDGAYYDGEEIATAQRVVDVIAASMTPPPPPTP